MAVNTVMVVEDDTELRDALCDTLELAGYETVAAPDGQHALELFAKHSVDLVVSDIQMHRLDGHGLHNRIKTANSDLPVLLMTAYGSVESAVKALRDGASDYLVKPFEAEVLVSKVSELLPVSSGEKNGFVVTDPKSREVFALAEKVAASDATVMITGESGTGKEVLFRYLHAHSPRAAKPAIAINCAAIPENMLEAMLFGYEKGAFTGAHKACAGKFELAQGGSLLLDEVSEMSMPLQAKLLRVLQEKEVERLGGHQVIKLDLRVIATSNRDLKEQVKRGVFREDLYYRLNVFPIRMPALRERCLDILPLAEYLLARAAQASGVRVPKVSDSAISVLTSYRWPGNVRELDNVMQRALIIHGGGTIQAEDISVQDDGLTVNEPLSATLNDEDLENLGHEQKAQEAKMILKVLAEGQGSRKFAAEKLGISPRTLRYKLARLREQGMQVPN
jgi:two-component system response regulator FlrC